MKVLLLVAVLAVIANCENPFILGLHGFVEGSQIPEPYRTQILTSGAKCAQYAGEKFLPVFVQAFQNLPGDEFDTILFKFLHNGEFFHDQSCEAAYEDIQQYLFLVYLNAVNNPKSYSIVDHESLFRSYMNYFYMGDLFKAGYQYGRYYSGVLTNTILKKQL